MIKNNILYVSGAIIFRDYRGKRSYLLIKLGENKWEIPKVNVRKGESSVRAALRMTGESAGINARVLEEAGRTTGIVIINGKSVSQRYYYYILMQRSASEAIGFKDFEWLEYEKATKKLTLKREKEMLKQAKEVLKQWEKAKQQKSR
jgi:ADP-ribose pyrophosphatase YjhB (NUDIX family)